eukprot:1905775-Amphidinium_carterae.2
MVPKPAQQRFAAWAKHMMSNHQWWFRDSLRCAQKWFPRVSCGVHSDTPRRWLKVLEDEEKTKPVPERKQKVPSPILEELGTMILDLIAKGAALNSSLVAALINEHPNR